MGKKNAKGLYTDTVAEMLEIKCIRGKVLELTNKKITAYLKIEGASLDLLSDTEKVSLIRRLTSELSALNHSFRFIAVSRPFDLSVLTEPLSERYKNAEDIKRQILRKELAFLHQTAALGETTERQFYLAMSEHKNREEELIRHIELASERFNSAGIKARVIADNEIASLINLINNPSYAGAESDGFEANIPKLIYKE